MIEYLNAKQLDKSSVIKIVRNYANNNMFFEAFSYLKHALYFHNIIDVYYEVLELYLKSPNSSKKFDCPLVIVWTISPKDVPFVFMADPEERLRQHMLGLSGWILDKSFYNIVIVENSNFKLNLDRLKQIGKEYNKNIEYYSFDHSLKAKEYGKGYGEGELVQKAFESSGILRSSSRFTKINGKLYLPFYEFCYTFNKLPFEFFNMHRMGDKIVFDTRFYCVNTDFYRHHLYNAHEEVNDHLTNYLEHVFYEKVKDKLNYWTPIEPVVFGKSGSFDGSYGEYPNVIKEFSSFLIKEIVG